MWAWAWMEWDGGGRGGDVLREGGLGTPPRAVVWGWKRGCDGRMGVSSQERKVGWKASSVFVKGRVRWSGVFSRYQRAKWCHQDDDRYRY